MKFSKIFQWGLEHRHPVFLVGLILFFILPEIFDKVLNITIPFQFLIAVLIVSSILLIQTSPNKRFWTYGLITALIVFIFIWNNYKDSYELQNTAYTFLFIYFTLISFHLYRDLRQAETITSSAIIGAFAGYFMIGVIFFFVYAILDTTYPETIGVDIDSEHGIEDMFYFSFITLTTIGYGDFSPTSVLGQKLAIVEGLLGQFYIAIIMAILVGKYLSNKTKN